MRRLLDAQESEPWRSRTDSGRRERRLTQAVGHRPSPVSHQPAPSGQVQEQHLERALPGDRQRVERVTAPAGHPPSRCHGGLRPLHQQAGERFPHRTVLGGWERPHPTPVNRAIGPAWPGYRATAGVWPETSPPETMRTGRAAAAEVTPNRRLSPGRPWAPGPAWSRVRGHGVSR